MVHAILGVRASLQGFLAGGLPGSHGPDNHRDIAGSTKRYRQSVVLFITGSMTEIGFWLLETFPALGRVS